MEKDMFITMIIFSIYITATIILILGTKFDFLTRIDLFLSLFHILFLNFIALIRPKNTYFLVLTSTIWYYFITTIIYFVNYLETPKTNILIFIIHHIVSIALILKFYDNKSPKIQNFILQIIFILNLSVICQTFYEFSRCLPNECREYNLKIYFLAFFLFRIIVFPIFIFASIKDVSQSLAENEKVMLSVIGVIFYLILWKWVFDLRKKF